MAIKAPKNVSNLKVIKIFPLLKLFFEVLDLNFFLVSFLATFSMDLKSASNSAFLSDTNILTLLHFLKTLRQYAPKMAQKRKNACYKRVLDITMASIFALAVHHFLKPGQNHGTLLYMYVQASRLAMLALMYFYR